MNTERYIASSRYSLIVAGAIFTIAVVFHADETAADFVPDATWQYVHVALGIALVLLSLGFSALAARTRSRDSLPMTASFIVFSLASGLASGLIFFVEGFVVPVAAADPALLPLLAEDGPLFGGAMGIVIVLHMAIWSLAAIASGIFIAKNSSKHGYAGYLMFGLPLAAFSPPLPHILLLVGGVAFGAAIFLLGLHFEQLSEGAWQGIGSHAKTLQSE